MTEGAGRLVQVGLTLPSFQSDPARVLAVARAAEDAGLDGVFLFDHLFRRRGDAAGAERRPALELMTMTAAVAAATRRVAVGTLVARATLRPPAMTRSSFDTLARIAPGRIIAGIGGGDDESIAEDTAFGVLPAAPTTIGSPDVWVARGHDADPPATGWVMDGRPRSGPFPTLSENSDVVQYRVARFEETVAALAGGMYPVWVAGTSPASIRLAASADGWNTWGGTASRFAFASNKVRHAVVGAGRDPAGFAFTWGGLAVLAPTPDEAQAKWKRLGGNRPGIVHGAPAEVARQIAAYADAGADWVILGPIDSANPDNAAVVGDAVRLLRSDAPQP